MKPASHTPLPSPTTTQITLPRDRVDRDRARGRSTFVTATTRRLWSLNQRDYEVWRALTPRQRRDALTHVTGALTMADGFQVIADACDLLRDHATHRRRASDRAST